MSRQANNSSVRLLAIKRIAIVEPLALITTQAKPLGLPGGQQRAEIRVHHQDSDASLQVRAALLKTPLGGLSEADAAFHS